MIGLDMTIRGAEDRSFRKSLDTFTVFGPSSPLMNSAIRTISISSSR